VTPTVDVPERLRSRCRAILWAYMDICDVPGQTHVDRETVTRLFTPDAHWVGGGPENAAAFGVLEGRDAIADMLIGRLVDRPHYIWNTHLLDGGTFRYHADPADLRTLVAAEWVMLRHSRLMDGTQETVMSHLLTRFAAADDTVAVQWYEPTRLEGQDVSADRSALFRTAERVRAFEQASGS
jgi:hypothetical protein